MKRITLLLFFYLKRYFWSVLLRRRFIFTDSLKNRYWQYPSDDSIFNFKRQSVADSQYLVSLINRLVKKGQTCVDVGAGIGALSVPMWKKVGRKGTVFSIDAEKRREQKTKDNIVLNGFPDKYVETFAVYSKDTSVYLNIIQDQDFWQSIGNPRNDEYIKGNHLKVKKEKVKALKLDTFLGQKRINRVNLLKVDVEGAELDVFRGAKKYINSGKIDYIIFEVAPKMYKWFNRRPAGTIKFLEKLGCVIYRIESNGLLTKTSHLLWPRDLHGDCLAVNKRNHNAFVKSMKKYIKSR